MPTASDYVLEGSVRQAAGRIRISAQLVDADNGATIWARAVRDDDTNLAVTDWQNIGTVSGGVFVYAMATGHVRLFDPETGARIGACAPEARL